MWKSLISPSLSQQRSAKKFKRDASLSQFEAGAKVNRETLLAAAGKCGVRVSWPCGELGKELRQPIMGVHGVPSKLMDIDGR